MTKVEYSLSEYERLRQERIRRNNERLAQLGLLDKPSVRRKRPKGITTPTTKTTIEASSSLKKRPAQVETRSSRRLKRKPALYTPPEDVVIGRKPKSLFGNDFNKQAKKTLTSKFRCEIPPVSCPLSKEEEAMIKKHLDGVDFLETFEDFLTNVDVISPKNRYNVMKQVTKLHSGEGIRYESKAYGWPEGCYFLKGTNVGPTSDILQLMELGKKCEEEWGKDRGNGWLLSHPLKKLYMFQQHCLLGK